MPKSFIGEGAIPITWIENHYPVYKNEEVLTAWLRAIEKAMESIGETEPDQ